MIRIVDYGVGNVQAFLNLFKRLGIPAERARTAAELEDATKLLLPGVGAFDPAITRLNESGMRPLLDDLVLTRGKPVLGVCVGMQMLADGSDEGQLPGLGWIPGRVRSFASHPATGQLPLPHMGWNDVVTKSEHPLFIGFEAVPRFYFLHSFFFECTDPRHGVAKAHYGHEFDCIVSNANVHGVQCHPEKSHRFGAQLLANFARS